MRLVCFLILCSYAYGNNINRNPFIMDAGPMVRTAAGAVLGKYVKVVDSDVAAFLGIPFAEPPVKERRFRKPQPLEPWGGIYVATYKAGPCMQYSSRNFSWIPNTATPSEDCLYLNVWAPMDCCSMDQAKLPVLVWLYGGGFYSGSADMDVYDGSTLASNTKSIVVSINYRVGIFGFLYSGTEEAPGIAGLLDQNLALRWVKHNIEYFGGDSNSITLMGQSAGAISITMHMVSPMSRNLFNRAILQSGTAYHPLATDSPEASFMKANKIAKMVGCIRGYYGIQSDPGVVECLKYKNPWELAKAEDMFTSKSPPYFVPTYGNEFLPVPPIKMFNEGHCAPVDVLIGTTKDEVTIFLNYFIPDVFRLDREPQLNLKAAEKVMGVLFQSLPSPVLSKIFQQYFQNVSDNDSREIVQTIAHAFGDFGFYCPTKFFAEKSRKTFMYWMTHRSMQDQQADWLGVPHFYDVPFVFGVPTHGTDTYNSEDAKFSKDLMNMWITFAKKGHPLADNSTNDWPVFSTDKPYAFELNPKESGSLIFPRAAACELWRPYITYTREPFATRPGLTAWPQWGILERKRSFYYKV